MYDKAENNAEKKVTEVSLTVSIFQKTVLVAKSRNENFFDKCLHFR